MRLSALHTVNIFFETETKAALIHGVSLFIKTKNAFATPRQFECTRLITAEHVKATIRRIPGFGAAHLAARRRAEH
ncbi:MAG: hypothetical protein K6U10_00180 [Acidobacteriia bacterium]|nr:hypothetical protein [Methyloceanibacter sp.]MCL6490219.1 hypothetical protein [Terriglobia bacterium]